MSESGSSQASILTFDELRELQEFLQRLLSRAVVSLSNYRATSFGYVHRIKSHEPDRAWSRASTATCLAFLEESGLWEATGPGQNAAQLMVAEIIKGEPTSHDNIPAGSWVSADLKPDNPFTVSFLLSALGHLHALGAQINQQQMEVVAAKARSLLGELLGGATSDGASDVDLTVDTTGVRIDPFPATAFLTYKAIKALDAAISLGCPPAEVFSEPARQRANRWAWRTLRAEIVALDARQADADPFELAYALLLVVRTAKFAEMAPADRGILRYALSVFFDHQTTAGTWPRSRPLFMYPKVGNAYCYDYELLTDMLGEIQLREMLLSYLPRLERAARALDREKYPLSVAGTSALGDSAGYAWASGHHRQDPSPESWATASAFHFVWSLQRLIAEAIRVEVFRYVGVSYVATWPSPGGSGGPLPKLDTRTFADSMFLDQKNDEHGLVDVIDTRFVGLIAAEAGRTRRGLPLTRRTPCSAIVYGPPGTSKTTLATLVAGALDWPLLSLDPSHLTRKGLDRLHEESNRVFGMLAAMERVVVLMDEFDELVRERGNETSEFVSRFLTTSMLPKLTALAERRKIVWLVATNHIEIFDSAIRRRGRFDMIVPLLPPTAEEKARRLGVLAVPPLHRGEAKAMLEDLTWGEYEDLVSEAYGQPARRVWALLKSMHASCTLMQRVDSAGSLEGSPMESMSGAKDSAAAVANTAVLPKTWKKAIDESRSAIRIPSAGVGTQ